ncbi:MAG: DUF2630 family protein [Solirubrobacteraceae bacterium]
MATGRREAQRDRMRARLLAAALDLFAVNGFDATTIDQIAGRADVARQTVLNHYPHKRDFVRAWGRQRRDHLVGLAEQTGPDEPARMRLRRYYAALAQMNERERGLTRMLNVSLRNDEVRALQWPVPDAVLSAIRRGQARGELDPDASPSRAAEVLTAIYADTLSRWLTEGAPPFDLSAALAEKLDLVLTGLAAHDPARRRSICEAFNVPSDQQIESQIEALESERETLRQREATTDPTRAEDAARLEEIRVDLDRLWDFLRQRRALRSSGGDPDLATERSAETVEKYWQ